MNRKIGFAAAVKRSVQTHGDDRFWALDYEGLALTREQIRFNVFTAEHFDGWLMKEAQVWSDRRIRGARFGLASRRRAPQLLVRGGYQNGLREVA